MTARTLHGLIALAAALLAGCASSPYRYGNPRAEADAPKYPAMAQQVYQGAPHPLLDAADWYWPGSLLGKLLLWDADIDSHEVSPETLAALRHYLELNGLDRVQVLVNRYAPGNQWRRLFTNRTVGAGWRYTLGMVSVALYTILPGRFFGGDAYNPYTHSMYLYSDDISIALHEAGHAHDFARRHHKGLHAFLYALPFVSLYYEGVATSDALSYSLDQNDPEQLRAEYKLLYPAYGTYVGGNLVREPLWGVFGVIPGHLIGRIRASQVSDDLSPPADAVDGHVD